MPAQRFPVGDGREVVISWRSLSGKALVRVGAESFEEVTFDELRRGFTFVTVDGSEVRVFALYAVPMFPLFDVYFAGRLLPGSMADPRHTRRKIIELLLLVAAFDLGAIAPRLFEQRMPANPLEWLHAGMFVLALTAAYEVWQRVPFAHRLARNFMLVRVLFSVFLVAGPGFNMNLDLGTFALYLWMKRLTADVTFSAPATNFATSE